MGLIQAIRYSASPKKKTIGDLVYESTNMRKSVNKDLAIVAKLFRPLIASIVLLLNGPSMATAEYVFVGIENLY